MEVIFDGGILFGRIDYFLPGLGFGKGDSNFFPNCVE